MPKNYIIIIVLISLFLRAESDEIDVYGSKNPGLHIISYEDMTDKERKQLRSLQRDIRQMHENGYVYSKVEDPKGIFFVQQPLTKAQGSRDLAEIKLAFPYSGPSQIPKENIYGYYGKYGMNKDGLLGIGLYFKASDFGTCNYERLNAMLSHDEVRIFSQILDYVVNDKATVYIVRGSESVGYSWSVDWYDEIYIHHLLCGNKIFSSDLIAKALALAEGLDNVH